MTIDTELLQRLERLALDAGRVTLDAFREGCAVESKPDDSPVTWADRESERIILKELAAIRPEIPVVSEEAASAGILPDALPGEFFLVDPLDGTREFVNARPDFTVNIALVRGGAPVLGVVYAPARGELYSGRPGHAFRYAVAEDFSVAAPVSIHVRDAGETPAVVASYSHRTEETDRFIARFPQAECVSVGSSLKFCIIARGGADIYPRFGRTMQWDTAAGDAVLRAAGGMTLTPDGRPLTYGLREGKGTERIVNPWFIATSGRINYPPVE